MKSDIEIAHEAKMKPVMEIARGIGLQDEEIELYGNYKAKISLQAYKRLKDKPDGKLILVTAINPTPAGEGKSTTAVGLAQGLAKIGEKVVVALREPSLGPCMGVKGGAAGGGYSQVVPMEDINLHFTGDMHAITSAHNLLAAMLDNHIHQGNKLSIDPRRVVWKRVVDMNDRALRNIIIGLGGRMHGVPREDGFDITVASEIMAILCLVNGLTELKAKLARIIVAYTYDGAPVTAADLGAVGAMTVLLKDAIKPNLVQTLENVPALIHGGPFANIAHGCNSIIATKLALKLADYVITEAGFGADLGAEKFFNIKCRYGKLKPAACVVVATVRALKMHGGVDKAALSIENIPALRTGFANLEKQVQNMREFGVPVMVAINQFPTDTEKEIEEVRTLCANLGVQVALSTIWAEGGNGGIEMANLVKEIAVQDNPSFQTLYNTNLSIKEKIGIICREIYGATGVSFSREAKKSIKQFTELGLADVPICMAKTQYSLSDDPNLLGRPENFEITVREVRMSAGAGFIVAVTGDIMTMPGLPKCPAAERIDIDEDGKIEGLF